MATISVVKRKGAQRWAQRYAKVYFLWLCQASLGGDLLAAALRYRLTAGFRDRLTAALRDRPTAALRIL